MKEQGLPLSCRWYYQPPCQHNICLILRLQMRGIRLNMRERCHPCVALKGFEICALQTKVDVAVAIYKQYWHRSPGNTPPRCGHSHQNVHPLMVKEVTWTSFQKNAALYQAGSFVESDHSPTPAAASPASSYVSDNVLLIFSDMKHESTEFTFATSRGCPPEPPSFHPA